MNIILLLRRESVHRLVAISYTYLVRLPRCPPVHLSHTHTDKQTILAICQLPWLIDGRSRLDSADTRTTVYCSFSYKNGGGDGSGEFSTITVSRHNWGLLFYYNFIIAIDRFGCPHGVAGHNHSANRYLRHISLAPQRSLRLMGTDRNTAML